MKVGGKTLKEGDSISIDGSTGEVILEELPTSPSEVLQVVAGTLKAAKSPLYEKFEKLLGWADEVRKLGVRANADIPRDAKVAFAFGARGIGLCRTEHMFFAEDRLPHVVKMILSAARGQRGTRPDATAEGEAGGGQGRAGRGGPQGAGAGREGVREVHRRLHRRPGEAAAHAAGGLRRPLPGDARPPGHHPHPRPAAARVPAQARGADGADRDPAGEGRDGEPREDRAPVAAAARGGGAARVQPHARPPRLPPGHHLPRDHAHAGAGHLRGRGAGGEEGHPGEAGGDDPARRPRGGAAPPGEHRARGGGRGAGQGAGRRRSSTWSAP